MPHYSYIPFCRFNLPGNTGGREGGEVGHYPQATTSNMISGSPYAGEYGGSKRKVPATAVADKRPAAATSTKDSKQGDKRPAAATSAKDGKQSANGVKGTKQNASASGATGTSKVQVVPRVPNRVPREIIR
jgi:hypothetical protein